MNVTRILPGTRPDADIYALTDSRLSLGHSLEEVASALLGAGVRILQYREKEMDGGEMLEPPASSSTIMSISPCSAEQTACMSARRTSPSPTCALLSALT